MCQVCFGVDVGGTTVKLGLVTQDGELLEKQEFVSAHDVGEMFDNIAAHMKEVMGHFSDYQCVGAGVGVPGPVVEERLVHGCANLGWGDVDVAGELGRRTGLPVKVANDANLAAMGEAWRGGGMGYRSMVLVTLGTGVGGGIILDGKCLRGAHRAGGEIGHIPVNPRETRPCNCGGHGCLEQYASATGCARLAREALAASTEPSALRALPDPDARAVWDAANAGDALALKIADEYCTYLARGLAVVTSTVDPEAIVLGGGVSRAGKLLLDMTRERYRPLAFPACKNTPIVLATLSNDAGIYGAMATLLAEK